MELKFSIENQIIKRTDNEIIVNKARNIIQATFTFNEIWNDNEKIVIFKDDKGQSIREYLGRVGASYTINVPGNVLRGRYFSVSVYAGDLLTTNAVIVYLKESGYTKYHHKHKHHPHGDDDAKDVFVDIYEKIYSCFDSVDFKDSALNFYSDGVLLYSVDLHGADEETIRAWIAEADLRFASIETALNGKADKIHTHLSRDVTDLNDSMDGEMDSLIGTLTEAINEIKEGD